MFTNCATSCLYVMSPLYHSIPVDNHSFISQENDPDEYQRSLEHTGTSVLHNLVDIQYEFVSVFRSNLDLIKCLWNHYRRHLKVEFSEIWAHGLHPLLQYSAEACTELNQKMSIEFATPTYLNRHPQRLRSDVLNLLTNWCEMPETVLDIFLNFDNDTKLVHCALFSDITAEIIELAAPSWLDDPTEVSLAMNKSLLVRAAETLRVLTRSICNMSGTAMLQRAQEAVTAVMGNLKLATSSKDNDVHESQPRSPTTSARHPVNEEKDDEENDEKDNLSTPIESCKSLGVVERHTYREKRRKDLDAALSIAKKRENLRKALKFLVAHDMLRNTPTSIGDFIRNYRAVLDPVWVGNYLGERGADDSEIVFLNRVRRKYVEGLDLSELTFVAALRTFLTRGGFMLPKEAQKIDRLLQSFADVYFEVCYVCVCRKNDAHTCIEPNNHTYTHT